MIDGAELRERALPWMVSLKHVASDDSAGMHHKLPTTEVFVFHSVISSPSSFPHFVSFFMVLFVTFLFCAIHLMAGLCYVIHFNLI
jgi:hypothetical protein